MANAKHSGRILDIRERTHDSVDKIMDKADSMNESGKEAIARFKEKAMDARENIDGYIQTNPEKSVLIAAGVGVVVGALVTAAMMRRRQ